MTGTGTDRIDEATKIAGKTHAQLREPFQKSLSDIARELQQQRARAIQTFTQENSHGSK